MRRALYIVLFLSVLACGLLLYLHGSKQEPEQSREALTAGAAVPLPPPRLIPMIPSRDAGNDAGRLVLDEQSLMKQIRDLLNSNPWLAETLAREDRQRFPDSPYAEARDVLLVVALFNQGSIDRARLEAYSYFEQHPGGRFTKYISSLTGVHPPPAGPRR